MKVELSSLLLFIAVLLMISCRSDCANSACPGACFQGKCICEDGCIGTECERCPRVIERFPEPIMGICPTHRTGDLLMQDTVRQEISVTIRSVGNLIQAVIKFSLLELGSDSTFASSEIKQIIAEIPEELELLSIENNPSAGCLNIDGSGVLQTCLQSVSSPVQSFEMQSRSFTSDMDVGVCSLEHAHANIFFNAIRIVVR